MINVLVSGALGKMGRIVLSLLEGDTSARAVCGVDKMAESEVLSCPVYSDFSKVEEEVDVVIDFSSPAALTSLLSFAKAKKCALVLATTGYSKEQLEEISLATKEVPIFKTANFSIGINLLTKLVKQAAEFLGEKYDVEIVEKHHNQKADAPSGTALMLADSVNEAFENEKDYLYGRCGKVGKRGKEIGIHAVRGGTIVGEHDVLFCGEDEVITFSHRADSKKVFATGAIRAAKFVAGKAPGLYDMKDVLSTL